MKILENDNYKLKVDGGVIKELYWKCDARGKNLADINGELGSISYTRKSEDIREAKNRVPFSPYKANRSIGRLVKSEGNSLEFYDGENAVFSRFSLKDGIFLEAATENPEISEFGINLDLNFIEKAGDYKYQFLPTSPNSSSDGERHWCIMTRPGGGFLLAAAVGDAVGWKIDYSSHSFGHFILGFKFLSSFDKAYAPEASLKKQLGVWLFMTATLDEAYEKLGTLWGVPYARLAIGANFLGEPSVLLSEGTDGITLTSPSGKTTRTEAKGGILTLPTEEFGFWEVVPHSNGVRGLDARIWYAPCAHELFDKSAEAIRAPYHPDDNLAEGGCFIWEWLLNMRMGGHLKFDGRARAELSEVMGEGGVRTRRKTIVPYKTEKFAPYHIEDSVRIQEQFFGVSILTEAYKLYGDKKYLEFAIAALSELRDNWITPEGMIFNGADYTTVCAPVIAVVDLANLLSDIGDERGEDFRALAIRIADYLLKRGISFPTEGSGESFEDGSISCTALSLLYVYYYLKKDERYLSFAGEVLELHRAWTVFSPDVRMNRSSFRWWETIWEGDGQGPAICAGHAWTIWKAEALYLYALSTGDEEALLDSWGGYMSNLVKTEADGCMYACFEPDYIRGGGDAAVKARLKQLAGEDHGVSYKLAHSYPSHKDNSLSRYAWIRFAYSWMHTAAVVIKDGKTVALNSKLDGDTLILSENIDTLFLGEGVKNIKFKSESKVKIMGKEEKFSDIAQI